MTLPPPLRLSFLHLFLFFSSSARTFFGGICYDLELSPLRSRVPACAFFFPADNSFSCIFPYGRAEARGICKVGRERERGAPLPFSLSLSPSPLSLSFSPSLSPLLSLSLSSLFLSLSFSLSLSHTHRSARAENARKERGLKRSAHAHTQASGDTRARSPTLFQLSTVNLEVIPPRARLQIAACL